MAQSYGTDTTGRDEEDASVRHPPRDLRQSEEEAASTGVTLWTFATGVGSGVALRFERVAAGCVKLAATMQAVGLGVTPTRREGGALASPSRSDSVRYAPPA